MNRIKRLMLALAVPVIALAGYLFIATGDSGSDSSSGRSAIVAPPAPDSGTSTGAADEYDHLVLPSAQR